MVGLSLERLYSVIFLPMICTTSEDDSLARVFAISFLSCEVESRIVILISSRASNASLICLIRATSFVREFSSGFTSDVTTSFSNIKNMFS